jgi:hypothetical protein
MPAAADQQCGVLQVEGRRRPGSLRCQAAVSKPPARRLPASRAGGNAPTVYRRLRVPMRREGVENEAKEAPSREGAADHPEGSKQPGASIVEHLPDAFLPASLQDYGDGG